MSSFPVLEKSYVQRLEALKMANESRAQQAAVKRALFEAGSASAALAQLARLVHEDHPVIQRMTFAALLDACHRIGPRRMRKVLNLTGISPTCRVQDLTARQRYRIAVVLNREV